MSHVLVKLSVNQPESSVSAWLSGRIVIHAGRVFHFHKMCSQFGATSYTSVTIASTFNSPGEIGT